MAMMEAPGITRRSTISTASTTSTPSDGHRSSTDGTATSTPRTSHSLTDRSITTTISTSTAAARKVDHKSQRDQQRGGRIVHRDTEVVGGVRVSDRAPTQAQLRAVADCPVYAADGTTRSFKSLLHEAADDQYNVEAEKRELPTRSKKNRVLVVFVRHFFCGICQEYIRTLTRTFDGNKKLSSLPHPTKLVIIGCGQPSLIPMYSAASMPSSTDPTTSGTNPSYPFEIYADPSQQLYKRLGMIRTLRLGDRRPDYVPHRSSVLINAFRSILQGIKSGRDATKGGDSKQVGGEFLFEFEDGDVESKKIEDNLERWKVLWCHRMRNTRDHTEMKDLKEVLSSSSSDLLSSSPSSNTPGSSKPSRSSSPSSPSSSSSSTKATRPSAVSAGSTASKSSAPSKSSSTFPSTASSSSSSAYPGGNPASTDYSYSYSCSCSAATAAGPTTAAGEGKGKDNGVGGGGRGWRIWR